MALIEKDGYNFTFNSDACKTCDGKCCIGESGYIWINSDEILNLSKYLNLTKDVFIAKYLDKFGFRYSLKEIPFENGYACVFFDTNNKSCQIYDLRPNQCKTFPFWEHFKNHQDEVEKECLGIVFL